VACQPCRSVTLSVCQSASCQSPTVCGSLPICVCLPLFTFTNPSFIPSFIAKRNVNLPARGCRPGRVPACCAPRAPCLPTAYPPTPRELRPGRMVSCLSFAHDQDQGDPFARRFCLLSPCRWCLCPRSIVSAHFPTQITIPCRLISHIDQKIMDIESSIS